MREDRDYEMAQFCIAFKVTPDEYLKLTLNQRQAFVEAWMEAHDA